MNKRILAILTIGLASSASGLDYEQWKNWCSKEKNKERCATAIRICEQNDNVDCDQIRTAFILEQPIPNSVLSNNAAD